MDLKFEISDLRFRIEAALLARSRFNTTLLTIFAVVALVMAAVGILRRHVLFRSATDS